MNKLFLVFGSDEFGNILHATEYPYRLCSYHYIKGKPAISVPRLQEWVSTPGTEWIMDSGLFTYMFGSEKGTITSYEQAYAYASKYVEFMHELSWKGGVVECDVQRLLDRDACDKLRTDVFDKSGLDVIYVWHLPETIDGLREMGATRKRMSLSIPELRQVYGTGVALRDVTTKLMAVATEQDRPERRIHLLGNTESGLMLERADSGDSSSWMAGVRYARGPMFVGGKIAAVNIRSPRWRAWAEFVERTYAPDLSSVPGYLHPAAHSVYAYQLFNDRITQ